MTETVTNFVERDFGAGLKQNPVIVTTLMTAAGIIPMTAVILLA